MVNGKRLTLIVPRASFFVLHSPTANPIRLEAVSACRAYRSGIIPGRRESAFAALGGGLGGLVGLWGAGRAVVSGLVAGHDGGGELLLQVADGARRIGQEDDLGASVGAHLLDGVEVLGHHDQVHDVGGGSTVDGVLELGDRFAQTVDDGFPLVGDALTLELLALGFGFGLLDLEDLVGFTTLLGGDTLASGGVDLVHGSLDLGVGVDVGDLDVDDLVAEVVHGAGELLLDGAGDLLLVGEHVVEFDLGHLGADLVENVGLDLAFRIAEAIEGLLGAGFEDLVLDGHLDLDAHLVLGDRLDRHWQLHDPQGQTVLGRFDERDLEAEAGAGDALELAEPFDSGEALLLDGEEGAEQEGDDNDERNEGDNAVDDDFH